MPTRMYALLFVLVPLIAWSQSQPAPSLTLGPSIPIFSSREDSIRFALLEERLQKLTQLALTARDGRRLDSIQVARRSFLDEHPSFVWRTLYRQDRSYTPYQSLRSINHLDSITTLSIMGGGRSQLPDSVYLLRNLSELELIGFRLSRIPRKLARNSTLKKLTILNNFPSSRLKLPRNTSITHLTIRGDERGMLPRSFSRLRNLTVLNLSRNNLREMPATARTKKLTSLVLVGNAIAWNTLPARQNWSLTQLDLNANRVEAIPSWIANYSKLKSLNLNNNRVGRIEPGIEKMKSLEEISLYRNNLGEIPHLLYTMTNLRVIDLYFNHIAKIDPAAGNWVNMEVLYLANNDLYSLPEEMGNMTRLKELYLHHNKLGSLPESIGNLKELTILRINHNRLTDWPEGIFRLRSLVNFDCSNNQFESLPMERFSFRHLKILSVGGNPWDEETRKRMALWAETLRENDTVVHLK